MSDQKITHQDLQDSISNIESRLEYLIEYMHAGFETMNKRFDDLEARFDKSARKAETRHGKQRSKKS